MVDQNQKDIEFALVALVPEAEKLVNPFRQLYDPSAAKGMPAHITINYPFRSIKSSHSAGVIDELQDIFPSFASFQYILGSLARFPGVLYLEPEPVEPFIELIQLIAAQFPDTPPYEGIFDSVIPHLTVADIGDQTRIEAIEEEFILDVKEILPIEAVVREIHLMNNIQGKWAVQNKFQLRI